MANPQDPRLGPEPLLPEGYPGNQVPPSVRYARGLLWLQGCIWAALASFSAVDLVIFMAQVHGSWNRSAVTVASALAVAIAAGGCALTEIRLARRLVRGRRRTRKTVIGIEIAMTCWGALLTGTVSPSGGVPADLFALAAVSGAALSLAAVVGLLRRRARQYFATPRTSTSDTKSDGPQPSSEPGPACVRRGAWGELAPRRMDVAEGWSG